MLTLVTSGTRLDTSLGVQSSLCMKTCMFEVTLDVRGHVGGIRKIDIGTSAQLCLRVLCEERAVTCSSCHDARNRQASLRLRLAFPTRAKESDHTNATLTLCHV